MRIAIANDHAGVELKNILVQNLKEQGVVVEDLGDHDPSANDAFAEIADRLISYLKTHEHTYGSGVCGSGQGMVMRANQHPGIRAALAWTADVAAMSRCHSDANVLCLGARVISSADAIATVEAFMNTEFEGGRHIPRLAKLNAPITD